MDRRRAEALALEVRMLARSLGLNVEAIQLRAGRRTPPEAPGKRRPPAGEPGDEQEARDENGD